MLLHCWECILLVYVVNFNLKEINRFCITLSLNNVCATISYRCFKQLLHTEVQHSIAVFCATTDYLEMQCYLKKCIPRTILNNNLLYLQYTLLADFNVLFIAVFCATTDDLEMYCYLKKMHSTYHVRYMCPPCS